MSVEGLNSEHGGLMISMRSRTTSPCRLVVSVRPITPPRKGKVATWLVLQQPPDLPPLLKLLSNFRLPQRRIVIYACVRDDADPSSRTCGLLSGYVHPLLERPRLMVCYSRLRPRRRLCFSMRSPFRLRVSITGETPGPIKTGNLLVTAASNPSYPRLTPKPRPHSSH